MNPIPDLRRRLEGVRPVEPITLTGAELRALIEMADEGAQRGRTERARRRRETKVELQIEDALRDQVQRVYAAIYTLKRTLGSTLSLKGWVLGRTNASIATLDALRDDIARVTRK